MVFAHAEDVEPDLVGEHDLLEQVAHPLLLAYEMAGARVGEAVAEGRDAELHHHRVDDWEREKGRGRRDREIKEKSRGKRRRRSVHPALSLLGRSRAEQLVLVPLVFLVTRPLSLVPWPGS